MSLAYPEIVAAFCAGNLETELLLEECGAKNRTKVLRPEAAILRCKREREAREEVRRIAESACGASLCLPYGRGGILAALYLAAVRRQSGLEIRLRDVPLLPETVALSEALGKNPYRMDTEALLFLTESGDSLARSLRAKDIPAACIGRFVPGLDKCVVDKTEREYINRPERGIELEAEVFETERKTDA